MNHRRLIAALVAGIGLAIAAWFLLPTPPPAVDVSTHSIVVDDTERSYRIAVPHVLPESTPVVFAFHGIGDSPDSMASYSQLDSLASDHGFLLVYPAGLNAMWAAIDVDPDALEDNRDVRFFDAVVEQLATQFSIDRSRIYLTGMSNGASFVQLLANARPSVVAAVVACSGPRPRALHDALRPFPILLIVGADDLALGSMQSDLDYYKNAGHDAKLVSVRGLGHAWSTHKNTELWSFLADCRLSP